jgi:pimeloyl-ACP methyl ester carboxylesterase
MHEIARDFKVIAMDLSGYGGTPYPEKPEEYSLQHETELLLEVVDENLGQEEPYHLVGHSYGGVVALYHAYHHSSRISSLTAIEPMAYHLLDTDHEQLVASKNMVAEITSDIEQDRNIEAAEKFIDTWMAPGAFSRLGQRERNLLGEGVKKMVLDFKAASSTPLTIDDYACLPRPFTVIAGRQSPPYSLAITDRIVTSLKGSELIWVDGGHFAPVTHYHQVNPLLGDILKAAEKP